MDPRRGDRPFREVAKAWQETWVDLEPKTKACYRTALDSHLLPEFGSRKVTAITPELVQKFINRMSNDGAAPGTVRGTYRVLRNALNAGIRLRMIAVNPCTGVRLPRQSKEEMLFLSGEEVQALAEAITPHFRVLIYTAAYTGLRSGELRELRALRRKRVDLLRGRLHVAEALKEINGKALAEADNGIIFGPTKNHQERTVTLPRFLRDMLNDHLTASPGGPDDLVFTSREGAPIRQSLLYRRHFKPAVKGRPASKGHPAVKGAFPERLHGLRFDDLRHTWASLLIAAGAHPKAIQEQLGHSSITITMDRYGHLLPSAHESLADRLDAAYTEASAPPENVRELRG